MTVRRWTRPRPRLRHISAILPAAIRAIRPGDPRLEAIATAIERGRDPVEALDVVNADNVEPDTPPEAA